MKMHWNLLVIALSVYIAVYSAFHGNWDSMLGWGTVVISQLMIISLKAKAAKLKDGHGQAVPE